MRADHDDAVYLPGETLQYRLSADFDMAEPCSTDADRDAFALRVSLDEDDDRTAMFADGFLSEAARHGFRLDGLSEVGGVHLAHFVRIGGYRAGQEKAGEVDAEHLEREHEREKQMYEEQAAAEAATDGGRR